MTSVRDFHSCAVRHGFMVDDVRKYLSNRDVLSSHRQTDIAIPAVTDIMISVVTDIAFMVVADIQTS